MFERFTPRGRQVVVFAQDEARLLAHDYIGTEHLLLGLLRAEEGVAAQVLTTLGLSLEATREQVMHIVGVGDEATTGQIPFTPRAKQALEHSLREGLSLGSGSIDTEHILLGLVREQEGVAVRILLDFDVDDERLRGAVIERLAASGRRATTTRTVPLRRRWAYRVETPDDVTTEWLNALGGEGWELAAARGDKLIFKRPR